jgi:hypothetical protein
MAANQFGNVIHLLRSNSLSRDAVIPLFGGEDGMCSNNATPFAVRRV